MDYFNNCRLCPRNCSVDRTIGKLGYCKSSSSIRAALASVHKWEEPPISGTKGSGTIFFSGCNLRCVFCQNYSISSKNNGKEISIDRLAHIMLEQQERGVHNINLVTAVQFVPMIIKSIEISRRNGLTIPIIYNSSGYEKVETIKMLEGYIDIYLPDIKYYSKELSKKYSNAPDYFKYASQAVLEMNSQAGKNEFDKNGILKKGIIIRHMILPGCKEDSFKVLDWIKDYLGPDIYVSILNQYTPSYRANQYKEINRRLMSLEYTRVIDHFFEIGLRNGYMQQRASASNEYIPLFDLSGL